jgi:hypothetical protein
MAIAIRSSACRSMARDGLYQTDMALGVAQARRVAAAARSVVGHFSHPYIRLAKVEGAFPKVLRPRTLYVLTEDGAPWQAAMICPCGCGETLYLNLLPGERPRWRFAADRKGRASLDPSVWRKIGCRSHFWLRGGRITWV